jgi:hypothetical protein
MRGKSVEERLQVQPRKRYRPPRLIAFGKIHTLVAGGSGAMTEGRLMLIMSWRA